MCRCLSRRLIVSERNRFAPWGDVAYRVNLFSAVMAAVTIGLVYGAGKLLAGNRPAAVVGALCLAVGFTFWSQVIIAPSRSKWALSATDVEDRLRASGFWSALASSARRCLLTLRKQTPNSVFLIMREICCANCRGWR
jgi:hypothetical protein